jgi:hypothetical protein
LSQIAASVGEIACVGPGRSLTVKVQQREN